MHKVLSILVLVLLILIYYYLYRAGKRTSIRRQAHYQARNMSNEALAERQNLLKLHQSLSEDEEIELEEIEIEIKHRKDMLNR